MIKLNPVKRIMLNKPMFNQPKQKRGRQRVDAILNSASELFAEVGYEAATIIEIAARADTSVGSMYQFFANKEAILYSYAIRNKCRNILRYSS